MRRLRFVFVFVSLLAALVLWAQEDTQTLKVEVDVVSILFSVRDKHNGLIPNLQKNDFTIAEDGKDQTIKYFAKESDLPITMGLLVDVSKSMENLIETEKHSAHQFFMRVLRPKDMAFIISFGTETELVQDYTNSQKLLGSALDTLRIIAPPAASMGPMGNPGPVPTANKPKGTLLYDAVTLAASEKLRREVGRKALILITDGVDQGSSYTLRDSIEAAQKADAIIYSIYYSDPQYAFFGGGEGELKKMSEETGGRVFRISRKQNLNDIFNQIQEEIRTQYMIGYTPTNPARDGTFRKIEIKTKNNKELKVQARKGYYAMPPETR